MNQVACRDIQTFVGSQRRFNTCAIHSRGENLSNPNGRQSPFKNAPSLRPVNRLPRQLRRKKIAGFAVTHRERQRAGGLTEIDSRAPEQWEPGSNLGKLNSEALGA